MILLDALKLILWLTVPFYFNFSAFYSTLMDKAISLFWT